MSWWPRRQQETPLADRRTAREVARLAHKHLPNHVAARWEALLRPAVSLSPAGPTDVAVANLGGRPSVPADFAWPEWEDHGPLSFIAEVDLDAISGFELDVGLPHTGRLLAFYIDISQDRYDGLIVGDDEESQSGARLVHLPPADAQAEEHPTPTGATEFPVLALTGHQVMTFPHLEHPALSNEFGEEEDVAGTAPGEVYGDDFNEALAELSPDSPGHQLGGWPVNFQTPIEYWPAQSTLAAPHRYDAEVKEEVLHWRLALQIDSADDAEMCWGDMGTLYWLLRATPGQPAGSLERTAFAWECS